MNKNKKLNTKLDEDIEHNDEEVEVVEESDGDEGSSHDASSYELGVITYENGDHDEEDKQILKNSKQVLEDEDDNSVNDEEMPELDDNSGWEDDFSSDYDPDDPDMY